MISESLSSRSWDAYSPFQKHIRALAFSRTRTPLSHRHRQSWIRSIPRPNFLNLVRDAERDRDASPSLFLCRRRDDGAEERETTLQDFVWSSAVDNSPSTCFPLSRVSLCRTTSFPSVFIYRAARKMIAVSLDSLIQTTRKEQKKKKKKRAIMSSVLPVNGVERLWIDLRLWISE